MRVHEWVDGRSSGRDYINPAAHGRWLVDECIAFSKAAGYRRIILWTNDVLVSARRIYEAAGFSLIEETPHRSFGHDLIGQLWGRDL
jgi:GNAT superfamily N-acetyltransferase